MFDAAKIKYRHSHSPAFAYPSSRMEMAGGMGGDPDEWLAMLIALCVGAAIVVSMVFCAAS